MINLELYRIFKIVADEENITKASEISKQDLELKFSSFCSEQGFIMDA